MVLNGIVLPRSPRKHLWLLLKDPFYTISRSTCETHPHVCSLIFAMEETIGVVILVALVGTHVDGYGVGASRERSHGPQPMRESMKQSAQPRDRKKKPEQTHQPPAAGPHGKKELTDADKTPGAGTLPPPRSIEDSTSG